MCTKLRTFSNLYYMAICVWMHPWSGLKRDSNGNSILHFVLFSQRRRNCYWDSQFENSFKINLGVENNPNTHIQTGKTVLITTYPKIHLFKWIFWCAEFHSHSIFRHSLSTRQTARNKVTKFRLKLNFSWKSCQFISHVIE